MSPSSHYGAFASTRTSRGSAHQAHEWRQSPRLHKSRARAESFVTAKGLVRSPKSGVGIVKKRLGKSGYHSLKNTHRLDRRVIPPFELPRRRPAVGAGQPPVARHGSRRACTTKPDLQAAKRDDVAGPSDLDFLSVVSVHLQHAPHALVLSLPGDGRHAERGTQHRSRDIWTCSGGELSQTHQALRAGTRGYGWGDPFADKTFSRPASQQTTSAAAALRCAMLAFRLQGRKTRIARPSSYHRACHLQTHCFLASRRLRLL